jgi:hypothetical protein
MSIEFCFAFVMVIKRMQSRNSAVGTATGYWLDDLGVRLRVQARRDLSLFYVVQTGFEVKSISCLMGTEAFSLGVKLEA